MKKTMKTILALTAILLMSASTYAQTEKGGWLVGASSSLNFSSGKADKDQDESETNLNLNPQVGYFVIDNLAVGLSIDLEMHKDAAKNKETVTAFGPFARYYFPMKIFAQAQAAFGSAKFDPDGGDSSTDKFSAITIGAGYAWMLNDNISIEPSLSYSATSYKPDGADESAKGSSFGINVGFALYFGAK